MGSQKKDNFRDGDILSPGTVLNERYEITGLLSSSSVSRMYRGKNRESNKDMAIKELLLEGFLNVAEKEQASKQFQMETRILLRLRHPNLPQFEDYFEAGGKKYLVMEYIVGDKMTDIIKNTPGMPELWQVRRWALQLSDVLEYLHNRKPNPIIFRGMCPENIILSLDGNLKLIDFGISKIFDAQAKTLAVAKTAKQYYSPMEQYVAVTDERTDIYSLGATLYFLATKEVPVDAVDRTLDGRTLPPCTQFNPDVPRELEEIIFKAMELEQSNRYPGIIEMKNALKNLKVKEKLTDGLPDIAEKPDKAKIKIKKRKQKKQKKLSHTPTIRIKIDSEKVEELIKEEIKALPPDSPFVAEKKVKIKDDTKTLLKKEDNIVSGEYKKEDKEEDKEEYEDDEDDDNDDEDDEDDDEDDEEDDDDDDDEPRGNFFERLVDVIINFLKGLKKGK